MDIVSIANVKDDNSKYWNLFVPQIGFNTEVALYTYKVQRYEEMRIDSVMLAIYPNNPTSLGDIDVILYINGIDNPLNIVENMEIIYPLYEALESFRIFLVSTNKSGKSVRDLLAVKAPNKTTRKDSSRSKYVESNYLLPPVVLDKPKDPVRVSGNSILIGGINNNQ
jgi:hypothetical protein